MACFSILMARVATPDQIAFVKFILESYDGLTILSTADPKSGEIVLRFHPDQRDELLALLNALQVDCGSKTGD